MADGIPINNSIRRWVIARSPNPNCSARHQTLVSTLAYPPPLHLIIETNLQQYSSGAGLLVSVVIAPLYSEQRWPLPPNTWAGPITVNTTTLIPLLSDLPPPPPPPPWTVTCWSSSVGQKNKLVVCVSGLLLIAHLCLRLLYDMPQPCEILSPTR